MKNTTNYTINAAAKEIIITKKFEKAANVIGSNEYKDLVTLIDEKYSDDFTDIKLPSLLVIKDGNIIGYTDYSLENSDDLDNKKAILKNKYIRLINM